MKIQSGVKSLSLAEPQIMAVINVTPDSFSDGGKHHSLDKALSFAQAALAEGASILDIGGESTRPGAEFISEQEELGRVIPVIEAISRNFDCWISIDTSKPRVMQEAVKAGAHLINDVCALQAPNALTVAAELDVPVCLMHMQGMPTTMQQNPSYQSLLDEVDDFFAKRIATCLEHGIKRHNIILDPGFGFGKTLAHNYQLLANLAHFQQHGLPVLAGMSRKSMIYNLVEQDATDVIGGSVACVTLAALQGAQIIRVHDVKETFQALQVVKMFKKEG